MDVQHSLSHVKKLSLKEFEKNQINAYELDSSSQEEEKSVRWHKYFRKLQCSLTPAKLNLRQKFNNVHVILISSSNSVAKWAPTYRDITHKCVNYETSWDHIRRYEDMFLFSHTSAVVCKKKKLILCLIYRKQAKW